jgi:HD superfamily phosphohydrolase YqeK
MSSKYNIDTSHSESHSMSVLHFADENYNSQLYFNPELKEQKNVIYCAAVLHDMCDKKYIEEEKGLNEIEYFLENSVDYPSLIYQNENYKDQLMQLFHSNKWVSPIYD